MQRSTKPLNTLAPAAEKTLLLVGGARNIHGTRISKRVKCYKCGTVDYITARPRGGQSCCRTCAQEVMNAFEIGIRVPKTLVKKSCFNCKASFELPVTAQLRDKAKPLCSNCMRGFEIWRGSLEMSPDNRQEMNLEKRRSGALLRKKSTLKK